MSLIRAHAGALVASIFVGIVIIAPQLAFIGGLGPAYQGIYLLNTDAELHYVARMQEAVQGGGIGNPFVAEFRHNVPSGFYSYSEEIVSLPARILPIPIPTLNLFYKFLLPALLALLVYALIFRLTASRSWSTVASITLVLGSTALNLSTALRVLRLDLWYEQFLLFSRPINPIFSLIIFFVFLHLLMSAERMRSWVWFVALGAVAGSAWYLYIYLGTTIFALLGISAGVNLIYKKIRIALQYLTALGIGTLIGIPGILSIASIPQHPYYELFVGPIGLVHTRMPYVHMPWLVVTGLFLWWWYHHKDHPHALPLLSLLLTSFAVVNQQVLTGLSLHPGHYLTYFAIPMYIVVLAVLGYEYFKTRSGFAERAFQYAFCAYVILAAAFIQYSSYVHWAPIVETEQRYAPVLAWLREHTPEGSVVMANQRLSELIAAYTADDVMWEVHANSYLMPQSRWDFTPENALAAENFCTFIKQYRLDYAVRDASDPEWSALDGEPCLRPMAELDGFTIYEAGK